AGQDVGHYLLRGGMKVTPHAAAVGADGGGSGDGHAKRLTGEVHGVRGAHPGADAGAEDGVRAHLGEFFDAELAVGYVPGREEHVLDVAVLAPVAAARLVAAGDDDRREVEPG